jgi:hypothetical protein
MRLPKTMDLKTPRGLDSFYRTVRSELGKGVSGTLTMDDGANWRIVVTIEDGKIMTVTAGASTGAAGTWSEA